MPTRQDLIDEENRKKAAAGKEAGKKVATEAPKQPDKPVVKEEKVEETPEAPKAPKPRPKKAAPEA